MADIQAILFWLSGVITPSKSEVLIKALTSTGIQNINLSLLFDSQKLNDKLALGMMDELEYCQMICNQMHLEIKPENLREKILAAIIPNAGIYETIRLLPKTIQSWLIVDYPKTWFGQIAQRIGIYQLFPDNRIIFISKSGLECISSKTLDYLISMVHVAINQCLIIDENPKRVIQAMKCDMPAIIFVDAQRLKREFILRKLITKP